MEFFFPEDLEKRLPPEEVTITSLSAEPYEDARRIRVNVEVAPFEKRPHIEVTLTDSEGQEVSAASFVEPMHWKLEFTMHVRTEPADGPLDLEARLFYPDGPQADPVSVRFELPPHRENPQT
jgi:hypothetical protein